MKICSKCKEEKESKEFYSNPKNKDGLKSWCKSCCKEDNQKRESSYNQYRKNYRLQHKEESKNKKKIYYKNNKEKILTDNSKWRQSIKGKLLSYKRSALKRNIEWNLSEEEFNLLWNKDCTYCGNRIETIGIDRINPNLGYVISNITPCCYQCNTMKLDYTEEEFLNQIKKIYELQRNNGRLS